MSIAPEAFSAAVMAKLEEFNGATQDVVDAAAETTAKHAKNELSANSPALTGSYAAGWRIKKNSKAKKTGRASVVVHNATDYQLTHLLEEGHAKVVWGHRTSGRVAPKVHIAPVEEKAQKEFESLIVSGIGGT